MKVLEDVSNPCPACGEPIGGPGTIDGLWACGPCRAEFTGSVVVRLLPASNLLVPLTGPRPTGREAVAQIFEMLASEMVKRAQEVGLLAQTIAAPPGEEAVAHAVMGEGEDVDLLHSAEQSEVVVGGLPPLEARRLVVAGLGEGPQLPVEAITELLRRATQSS